MPARDRRNAPITRRPERSADVARGASPPRLVLWRLDAEGCWPGADPVDPFQLEAQALFADPAAARARRAWAERPERLAEFNLTHSAPGDRKIVEWSVALDASGGDAPAFATVFHLSSERETRSTDMLSNRRARQVLRRRLEAAINAGGPSASVAFGVDNLSELNQIYGFDVADAVLGEVAARIRAAAGRESRGSATIRHLSGSKFGLVASGADGAAARRIAEAAQNAVAAAPIRTNKGGVAATVSAGVATQEAVALDSAATVRDRAGEIMARALDVLSSARRVGPSGLKEARLDADPDRLLDERRRIAQEAMAALEAGRIGVAFQPIVASASRRPAFHECLARILRTDGSIAPAGGFIPVIEQLGQVRLLDRRMLSAVFDALEDAARARLSLNVSAQTLRDAEWLSLFRRRAADAPRAAERLIVEITESSASGDPAAARAFMDAVRAQGAAFALDDFGAGYTALRQLRDFRFDFLKIDGSFVSGVAANPDNRLFIRVMAEIAQHFEMATVAEFVETEADAETLADLSITYQQGYLHGPPSMELSDGTQAAKIAGALSA